MLFGSGPREHHLQPVAPFLAFVRSPLIGQPPQLTQNSDIRSLTDELLPVVVNRYRLPGTGTGPQVP